MIVLVLVSGVTVTNRLLQIGGLEQLKCTFIVLKAESMKAEFDRYFPCCDF